jgi:hypothetical protein
MAAVKIPVLAAALAAALLAVLPASASRSEVKLFKTPSGNIGCVYDSALGGGIGAALRCDIRSGLNPKPARPRNCDLDFGDSIGINRTGRAYVVCHGDTALDPRAPVLRYGTTWRRNGFTCTSRTTGLRCTNASGHGFFLSRERWSRF